MLTTCSKFGITGIEDTSASEDLRPPNAIPGVCYGHILLPAVFETVTEHSVQRAATYDGAGKILTPNVYRTDTVHKIVRDRYYTWFESPCAKDTDDKFVASVQRALKVRAYYGGRVTGEYDQRTRRAIRKFQKALGLDSDTLSIMAARKLGLVAVERQASKGGN